jgi:hypothetical protein
MTLQDWNRRFAYYRLGLNLTEAYTELMEGMDLRTWYGYPGLGPVLSLVGIHCPLPFKL